MAKKKAKREGQSGGRGKAGRIILMIMVVPLVLVSLPTFVLLVGGMLPTLVALLIDRTPQRYAARCVGGINFSGVLPFVLPLWTGGRTINDAIAILSDPFKMLIIYGCAGLGWVLYIAIPPLIGSFLSMAAQKRISTLRKEQGELVEEWGEEVGHR